MVGRNAQLSQGCECQVIHLTASSSRSQLRSPLQAESILRVPLLLHCKIDCCVQVGTYNPGFGQKFCTSQIQQIRQLVNSTPGDTYLHKGLLIESSWRLIFMLWEEVKILWKLPSNEPWFAHKLQQGNWWRSAASARQKCENLGEILWGSLFIKTLLFCLREGCLWYQVISETINIIMSASTWDKWEAWEYATEMQKFQPLYFCVSYSHTPI